MSGSETLLVLVVALLLFGGKRMPELARAAGRMLRNLRRAWEEVKRQMGVDLEDSDKKPPKVG